MLLGVTEHHTPHAGRVQFVSLRFKNKLVAHTSEHSQFINTSFRLNTISNELELGLETLGRMFRISTAVIIASHQYVLSIFASLSIQRVISTSVQFSHSAIPFCSGLYGTVNSCLFVCFRQNRVISLFRHSPPSSLRSTVTSQPHSSLIL